LKKSRKLILCFSLCIILSISFSHHIFRGESAENAISLNQSGWKNLENEDYNQALYNFLASIRLNPSYVDSRLGAGKAYLSLGVYDRALDMFTSVLKFDNQSVDALTGVGMILAETGRFSDSISYFEKALAIKESSLEAHYGLAYSYYKMDKKLWAKRRLNTILKINPYHFESLLLLADIKTEEGRLKEARELVEKAIDAKGQSPVGFARYGRILFKNYILENDENSLTEAREYYAKSLSIKPAALNSLKKAAGTLKNPALLYAQAVAYEFIGDKNQSAENLLKLYKANPSDSIVRSKLEDFLVLKEFKSAHPTRVMLSGENIALADKSLRESLHNKVIYYLRRALLLNPINKEVRERLINYYSILDYNAIMIDEIKNLLRQYPEIKYQEMLNIEIMKRRDRLDYREGYTLEDIQRDVPVVLVMNFDTNGKILNHFDAGKTLARNITFALHQNGRMKAINIKDREEIASILKTNGDNLAKSIKKIKEYSEANNQKIDYILFGDIAEVEDYIKLNCKLLDLQRDFIIAEFSESTKGKEAVAEISLSVATRLYDIIPYSGHAIKIKEKGIIVNLGLFDGIKNGSQLIYFRTTTSRKTKDLQRYVELLTVKESDTFICYAEPDNPDLMNELDTSSVIYPLKNRRAKKIE
jgi:tetratricopeptide (TPR) repeat protein